MKNEIMEKQLKKIVTLAVFIGIILLLHVIVEKKIIATEIAREKNDINILNEIKQTFDEALKNVDVQQYVLNKIGEREEINIWVGYNDKISFDVVETLYKNIFENLDTSVTNKVFSSKTCRNNNQSKNVYVYINRYLEVSVKYIYNDWKTVEGEYSHKKIESEES